jgi:hypothetical protein
MNRRDLAPHIALQLSGCCGGERRRIASGQRLLRDPSGLRKASANSRAMTTPLLRLMTAAVAAFLSMQSAA